METIDLLITVYKNYSFLRYQIQVYNQIFDSYRLLICDTTPPGERNDISEIPEIDELHILETYGIDGEIHGAALDLLVRKATSKIVGICDSDFFWLKPGMLQDIRKDFAQGYKCVGCAGWYDDWQKYLDPRWPERAGHLAPVVWGMFIDRELALSETFVVTSEEANQTMETGWRIRKKIIEENIPNKVFPGFRYPEQPEEEACYFGAPGEPLGMHFLRGSAWRFRLSHLLAACVEYGRAKWIES